MKALFLAHHLPPSGRSSGRLALEYAKLLRRKGVGVEIVTAAGLGGKSLRRWQGIDVRLATDLPFSAHTPHVQAALDALGVLGRVAFPQDDAPVPDVLVSFDWPSGISGMSLKRTFGKPLVFVYNGAAEARGAPRGPEADWIRGMEEWALDQADAVIAPSEHAKAELKSRFPNLRHQAEVMPTVSVPPERPLQVDREELRRTLGGPEGRTLLFVGACERRNGFDLLLATMPGALFRDPSVRFVIVGDPPSDGQYQAELDRAQKSGRVRCLGPVGDTVLEGLLRVADARLVPARYDPSGVAFWESAQAEIPVIALSTPAAIEAGELIRDLDILPADDPPLFLEAILRPPTLVAPSGSRRGLCREALGSRIALSAGKLSDILSRVCSTRER